MIEWGELQDDPSALERFLAERPDLRREYESYVNLQAELRMAVAEEPVPHERLEFILAGVVPKVSPFQRWTMQWGPRLAVAFTIGALMYVGVAMVNRDPIRMDVTPQYSELRTGDAKAAAMHVRASLNIQAPIIPLAQVKAAFQGVRTGGDWATYDYLVGGEKLTLVLSRVDHFDRAEPMMPCDGVNYYKGRSGCGWRQNDLAFYLQGPDAKKLQEIAHIAVNEIKADETCN